jgi:hypothetical protein
VLRSHTAADVLLRRRRFLGLISVTNRELVFSSAPIELQCMSALQSKVSVFLMIDKWCGRLALIIIVS